MYQKAVRKISAAVILVYLISLLAGNAVFAQSSKSADNSIQKNQTVTTEPTLIELVNGFISNVSSNFTSGSQDDWQAAALIKAGKTFDQTAYVDQTKANLLNKINDSNSLPTDIERMTIGLAAAGVDVSNIKNNDGKNPIDLICNSEFKQGLNAKVFALIALDSKGYQTKPEYIWNREKLIQSILDSQVSGGGWTYFGDKMDADMTSLVITGLAPYKNYPSVNEAVENALNLLSSMQNAQDGDFYTTFEGNTSSNSCTDATIITALSTWGCGVNDSRFVKNGHNLFDILLSYKIDNMFEFTHGVGADSYSTEQGFTALVAYMLYLTNSKALYDFQPASVYIRIEGKDKTILPLTKVTPNLQNLTDKIIAFDILNEALTSNNIASVITDSTYGKYISSIDGEEAGTAESPNSGWMFAINDQFGSSSIDSTELKNNDILTVFYEDDWSTNLFTYFTNNRYIVKQGASVTLELNGLSGFPTVKAPVADASIYIEKVGDGNGEKEAAAVNKIITDKDGKAVISHLEAGVYRISAKKTAGGKNILTRPYAEVYVADVDSPVVSDLPSASDWSKAAIQRIFNIGLMQGVGDGLFDAHRQITRAEAVTSLMRFLNISPDFTENSKFSDVSAGDWYFSYVNKAASIGLVNGRSGDVYAPNDPVTREELAAMLDRILVLSGEDTSSVDIKDISNVSTYAVDSVKRVYKKGFLIGYEGVFDPKGNVSREMMAVLLERLYDQYYNY